MKRCFPFVFLTVFSLFVSSCRGGMEPVANDPVSKVPLVILDTDLGSSADDLFAMEILYRYEAQKACKLLGVIVDREGACNAAIADVMNTYFGRPELPIGLERSGVKEPKIWIDYGNLPDWEGKDGQPMFKRSIKDYSILPDAWKLYRSLLSAQEDGSVSIVSVGFVTSLAQLLQSGPDEFSPLNGVELVRKKVRCLYIVGGRFEGSEAVEPDYNFVTAGAFSRTFFNLWPADVPMIFSPVEVGHELEYSPDRVIEDISWTEVHPIKQVYLRCDCNTGQRMWDPLAVIHAVEGDGSFSLSPKGTVQYTDEGVMLFTPSENGNSRYQVIGSAQWNKDMLEKIRTFNKMK